MPELVAHVRPHRRIAAGLAVALTTGTLLAVSSSPPSAAKGSSSTAYGYGGAVSSVDANASKIGLEVLRKGGNAADAAVATASALGVSEPYSAGIGGGGYFVYYDARTPQGQHDRRPRDRPGGHHPRRVHRPGDRQALQVHARARLVGRRGRRARHAGDVGLGAQAVRHPLPGSYARPVDRAGPQGIRRRRHVPQPDARQQGALRRVPRHRQAVPPRR